MNSPWMKRTARTVLSVLLAAAFLLGAAPGVQLSAAQPNAAISPQQEILVDDFTPQPLQGDTVYYYNRLGGDRGALNNSTLALGSGQMTVTLAAGQGWGGIYLSLNHPDREGLGVDFSAVLPAQIQPQYQSQVNAITVQVAGGTPGRRLKLELKDGGTIRWTTSATLAGGAQTLSYPLPALGKVTTLVVVLDQAAGGDQVILDKIALTAVTAISDPLEAAFVWSYAMLLNNWDPATGLVRDKAINTSEEFNATQCAGSLAAATALAARLGMVSQTDAVQIVDKIADALLNDLPRYKGLWPHWVTRDASGAWVIVPDPNDPDKTEWSSVDTAIAALGLLDAQVALGLDPGATVQFIQEIDWDALLLPTGLSHGYTYGGALLTSNWDTFGGESVLIDLLYASAEHTLPALQYPTPPTANGSGFIDELSWLFVLPPGQPDAWGVDWDAYRAQAAAAQLAYYPAEYPGECFDQLGLFGLSAGEVPDPSAVAKDDIYQAFGVGGRFSAPNDGSLLLGYPVVLPHYSGMLAALHPQQAEALWEWLIAGPFSPLNNIESLAFPAGAGCTPGEMTWNHLKGSWNLALQTLGLGRLLAQRGGQAYAPWLATLQNPFLRGGYEILFPGSLSSLYLPLVFK